MQPSLSYHLTLLVIRLKGIKRDFSRAPINVEKIRREDVQQPQNSFFRRREVGRFTIANTVVTEIRQQNPTGKLVLFVHGGAFISGPTRYHWQAVQTLAEATQHDVWMCDYPKAPEHKIAEISANIDQVYAAARAKYAAEDITLIGDSVGGTLVMALVQRVLEQRGALPRQLILVCPVLDATFSNPQIAAVDKIDPMLSRAGVRSAKEMCAGDAGLENKMISPIHGAFAGFPRTILFLAENDITYPDQLLAADKLVAAHVDVEVVTGVKMPHIWPYLPVMHEAKVAMQAIVDRVNR